MTDNIDNTYFLQATLLTQALPFMRHYHGSTIVIKYGGNAMGDRESASHFAHDIVLLKQCGVNPIIVHGGGPQIDDMLKRLSIESRFIDGLRYSDAETVAIAEMVLCGNINKQIVHDIEMAGGHAIGISGKDNSLITAKKLDYHTDLGFVGEPAHINPDILNIVSDAGVIPVIAPIAPDNNGQSYNINADTVAGAIANVIHAKRLVLLTDVEGVLDKDKKLIKQLSVADIHDLKAKNILTGGMIPKTQTCVNAVSQHVEAAVILDGRIDHAIILELFTELGAGTLISK